MDSDQPCSPAPLPRGYPPPPTRERACPSGRCQPPTGPAQTWCRAGSGERREAAGIPQSSRPCEHARGVHTLTPSPFPRQPGSPGSGPWLCPGAARVHHTCTSRSARGLHDTPLVAGCGRGDTAIRLTWPSPTGNPGAREMGNSCHSPHTPPQALSRPRLKVLPGPPWPLPGPGPCPLPVPSTPCLPHLDAHPSPTAEAHSLVGSGSPALQAALALPHGPTRSRWEGSPSLHQVRRAPRFLTPQGCSLPMGLLQVAQSAQRLLGW